MELQLVGKVRWQVKEGELGMFGADFGKKPHLSYLSAAIAADDIDIDTDSYED